MKQASPGMSDGDFHTRYSLLERVTEGAVRTHHAVAHTGAVVMVHLVDASSPEGASVLSLLEAVTPAEREKILAVEPVEEDTAVVTRFILDFESLRDWLELRSGADTVPPTREAPRIDAPAAAPPPPQSPGAEAPLDAPPTSRTPPTEPPAETPPATRTPPPAASAPAPPPSSGGPPGEFTRMFRAAGGDEPGEAEQPDRRPDPPPPPAQPGARGVAPEPPGLPGPGSERGAPPGADAPGEFTRMFRAAGSGEDDDAPAGREEQAQLDRPGATPVPEGGGPGAPPDTDAAGEFTGLFRAPRTPRAEPDAGAGAGPSPASPTPPSRPAKPSEPDPRPPDPPARPRHPAAPGPGVPSQAAGPELRYEPAPPPPGPSGKYTELLRGPGHAAPPPGGGDLPGKATGPPPRPEGAGGPGAGGPALGSGDDDYLRRLHQSSAGPDAAHRPSPQPPAPPPPPGRAAGPSEFTRVISAVPPPGTSPQGPPPPPRSVPAGRDRPESGADGPSALWLVLGLVAVAVLAVAIVLFFALRDSPAPPPETPPAAEVAAPETAGP